jgi:hypothetical protein
LWSKETLLAAFLWLVKAGLANIFAIYSLMEAKASVRVQIGALPLARIVSEERCHQKQYANIL